MDTNKIIALKRRAAEIRINTISGIYHAASGHPGGSLSIADILAVLYFDEMNIDSARPDWPERDRLVLSKGHSGAGILCGTGATRVFPGRGYRHAAQDRQPPAGAP